MYKSFYQLQTNPFSLTPDPKFCYSHSGYMQAREYLDYALKLGEGLVMVTGRPGTGKTTLIESFLATLNMGRVNAVRIAASNLDAEDLLRAVAYAYNLKAEGKDKATLRHHIKQFFEEQLRSGRRALLIIDEAQGLPRPALEELRLLADLQTGSRQLLQLFLVGQEQLREQMSYPEMDHFQQRVIANYHLVPLDLMESRAYMEFRLHQAGWQGDPEITGNAVLDIYRFSRGVPRHINKLCNRLLLLGYGMGSHKLDSGEVQTIAAEMDAELLRPMASNQPDDAAIAEMLEIPEITPELLLDLAIRVKEQVPTGAAVPAESTDEVRSAEHLTGHDTAELFPPAMAPDLAVIPEPASLTAPAGSSDHAVFRDSLNDQSKLRTALTGWQENLAPLAAMLIVGAVSISVAMDNPEETVSQQDVRLVVEQELPDSLSTGTDTGTGMQQMIVLGIPTTDSQQIPAQQIMVAEAVLPDVSQAVSAPGDATLQQVLDEELPATAAGPVPVQIALLSVTDEMTEVSILPAQDVAEQAPVDNVVADITSVTDMTAENELQADVLRAAEIEGLIAQGQRALKEDRLLTPAQDSAYIYFQSTLKLEPDNAEAAEGMEQIVEQYVLLANKALAKQKRIMADRYIARGLSIQPDNSKLLALKEVMQVASESSDVPVTSLVLEDGAASQGEGTRKGMNNLFTRLKAFFDSHAKVRSEILATNQQTSSSLYE
jgi:type II secretory pathway predicted ATPase ExeA